MNLKFKEIIPGESSPLVGVLAASGKMSVLFPVSDFRFIIFEKNKKTPSGEMVLGEYPTISNKKIIQDKMLHIISHPETASVCSRISGTRDSMNNISPFLEDDTVYFDIEKETPIPHFGVIFSSKKNMSRIMTACITFGGFPAIIEPFWSAVARRSGSSKDREGRIFAALFDDFLCFGANFQALSIFQSSIPLSDNLSSSSLQWGVRGLVQELRNAGVSSEKQEIIFLYPENSSRGDMEEKSGSISEEIASITNWPIRKYGMEQFLFGRKQIV